MAIRDWSTTATGNATVAGINWAEGQAPSTVNNSARETMAQIRQEYTAERWGWVAQSGTASVASQTTVKVAGDITTDAVQYRKIKLTGGTTTVYANIVSSSYTSETTITIENATGSLSASHQIAWLAASYDKTIPSDVLRGSSSTTFTQAAAFLESVSFSASVHFTGSVEFKGTASFSATAEFGVIVADNITFPATQVPSADANTLDDYEEGTWSPTAASSAGSITSYTSSGVYTKIGRMVIASATINITDNGTGAGYIQVSLPFTSGSGNNSVGSGRENVSGGKMLQWYVAPSSATGDVYNYDNSYPGATGYTLILTVCYIV